MSSVLAPGTQAPDFTLSVTPDQKLSLHDLRGQPVVLAFYPADWSPVCGDQMTLYNEILPEFQKYKAEVLGISVDGAWCHAAFAKHQHLHFRLLSDFEPKGAVSRAYGVYSQRGPGRTGDGVMNAIRPEAQMTVPVSASTGPGTPMLNAFRWAWGRPASSGPRHRHVPAWRWICRKQQHQS